MPIGAIAAAVGASAVTGMFNRSTARDAMAAEMYSSNTSHQREVQDLYAAGLNPILSARYGGAPGIKGSSATMPDLAQAVVAGLNTAKAKYELKELMPLDRSQKEANINLTDSQTRKALQEIRVLTAEEMNKINNSAESYARLVGQLYQNDRMQAESQIEKMWLNSVRKNPWLLELQRTGSPAAAVGSSAGGILRILKGLAK